jgi:hypothetical protein
MSTNHYEFRLPEGEEDAHALRHQHEDEVA